MLKSKAQKFVKFHYKDGSHDLDAMLAAIDENTSVVWVCSPNNPTGTIVSDEELQNFLKKYHLMY